MGIIELIAVYGISFIILVILSIIVIFRIIRRKSSKDTEITVVAASPKIITNNSDSLPNRMEDIPLQLSSSDFDIEKGKPNIVIGKIEQLSPLKRGILWAEILGKPGGRRRRNT